MNRRFNKILALCLCAVILCTTLCSCETWNNFRKAFIDPPQPEIITIKLGIFEPITGRQSYDSEDEIKGIELAHELFPSVFGYDINLVYADNHSSTQEAPDAVQKLYNQDCMAMLGSYSDTLSLAASDKVKELQLPSIAATNTIPILTQTNPYYFRVSYINSYDAEAAAQYAANYLEAKHCVILTTEGNDYAEGKAMLFEETFYKEIGTEEYIFDPAEASENEEQNTETQSRETQNTDTENSNEVIVKPAISRVVIPAETQDYTEILTQIETEMFGKKGIVYCPEKASTALAIIKAAHENEFDIDFIGTSEWMGIDELALSTYEEKDFLNHVAYTIDYDSFTEQSEMGSTFIEAYRNKYGKEEKPSASAALGFDAYLLFYTALKSYAEYDDNMKITNDIPALLFNEDGTINRNLLNQKLLEVKNMEGATGKISMNPSGDPLKNILIERFEDPGFSVVYDTIPNMEE